ncbi:MAG: biopolymer transporter ExbB [Neomegalonema sp.]|nr:biopolymer transporter ExbB [Neomegalonema sp.]
MANVAKSYVSFTRPLFRIVMMLAFLGIVGAVGAYLYTRIVTVFESNPALNGLIVFVFVIGIIVAFWQVARLFSAVNWLESLAAGHKGIESIRPPGLLVAMEPLRTRDARTSLGASSVRSILDSVDARLDESRDILRYIGGLLIFLGLLGTFWGLANTVPAVVETIRAITPQDGETGSNVFSRLMAGLDSQLGGMGAAFASSLLGLAGSLVIGFLELMTQGAQNRFYSELEGYLSSITRISAADGDGVAGPLVELVDKLAENTEQMQYLTRLFAEAEERRTVDSNRIADVMQRLEQIAGQAVAERESIAQSMAAQSRLIASVEKMAEGASLGSFAPAAASEMGLDAETRRHIRNIDQLLARFIEESAMGRQETADALRREMRAVGRAVTKITPSNSSTRPPSGS